MAKADLQILIQAWLRRARRESDPAAWLDQIHEAALLAVTNGDTFVTATRFDGLDSTLVRGVEATELLQIAEMCLQHLEAEAELEEGDVMPPPGAARYADFSTVPARLG
jgi:hypothetical protein